MGAKLVKKEKRISRDQCFMSIANLISERGTCNRAQVGAVLVDNETNSIVATGYNGSLPGGIHCKRDECIIDEQGHCRRCVHAEMNAVLHLEKRYKFLKLYCTHKPCVECYKALVMSNVKEIYYRVDYRDIYSDILFIEGKGLVRMIAI